MFLLMDRGVMLLGMILAVVDNQIENNGELPTGLIKGALVAINREYGISLSV